MCPVFPAPGSAPLEECTHNEMAESLLAPAGKRIVDVGCGEGALTRFLAGVGAEIVGIDPAGDKIESAASAAVAEGSAAEFRVGVGEALPFDDRSLDVVLYANSLHHVPIGAMRPALAEAARALRRGGVLYAMEPLAVGAFHDVISLWNDETEVRARAYEALEKAGEHGFEAEREVFHAAPRSYADYADFANLLRRQNAKHAKAFAEMDGAIRARFERHARADDGAFILDTSYRVNVLKRP